MRTRRKQQRGGRADERRAASVRSVYNGGMANKKRVNITIDPDIHTEMQALLDSAGMDFSGFVEMLCVRFLGEIRPVARRLDEMTKAGLKPTDAEVKLLLLGMFTTAQLDMGKMMNDALEELDILQMDKVLEGEVKKKPIHTKKPAKAVKPKA